MIVNILLVIIFVSLITISTITVYSYTRHSCNTYGRILWSYGNYSKFIDLYKSGGVNSKLWIEYSIIAFTFNKNVVYMKLNLFDFIRARHALRNETKLIPNLKQTK